MPLFMKLTTPLNDRLPPGVRDRGLPVPEMGLQGVRRDLFQGRGRRRRLGGDLPGLLRHQQERWRGARVEHTFLIIIDYE